MLSCELIGILGHSHIIPAYKWVPTITDTRAVLLIVHGMAEHGSRYNELAEYLVSHSISVYAFDLRGHGQCTKNSIEGYFADKNGDKLVLADIDSVLTEIRHENPGIPIFILGHSLGSIFIQDYLSQFELRPEGVILSGIAYSNVFQRYSGYFLASLLCILGRAQNKSPLLTALSFGAFNKAFEPTNTEYDWLNRDMNEVTAYITNPWCGFICTTSLFRDMLKSLNRVSKMSTLVKMNKDIPILIIAGDKDPVGNMGKGAILIKQKMEDADIQKVTLKLYEDARHEVLNELNKSEVYKDVMQFMDTCLSHRDP